MIPALLGQLENNTARWLFGCPVCCCFPLTHQKFSGNSIAQDVACSVQDRFCPAQAILKGRGTAFSLYPHGCTPQHLKPLFMPRQNKAADRRRSERFEMRLTKEEAHLLVMRSIAANMTTSDFIRRSALGSDAYMVKAEPDRAALILQIDELNKIGMVISQIVRSGKYANATEQTQLMTDVLTNIKTLSGHLIKKLSS
jgi:hypothetical protein